MDDLEKMGFSEEEIANIREIENKAACAGVKIPSQFYYSLFNKPNQ